MTAAQLLPDDEMKDEMKTKTKVALTVEDIEREIHRMDANLNGQDFKIAVILMSALHVEGAPTVKKLTDFTAYSRRIVEQTVRRARDNGIFTNDGRIAGRAWFGKDGGIAFWCDVACCAGFLQKVPA